MKKSILNLGKALNKLEQKQIQGGKKHCSADYPCNPPYSYCNYTNPYSGYCVIEMPYS